MKKRNKFIFLYLLIFLVSIFTVNTFADDSYFVVPYDAGRVLNDLGAPVTSEYFSTNSYNEYDDGYYDDRSVSWIRKDLGVLGVFYSAGTGYLEEIPNYIVGDIVIQMPWQLDTNPRVTISFGKSNFQLSNQTDSAFGFVGWTIRCSEGDKASMLRISTWRTSSFTLDYPSSEVYDFDIGHGELTAFRDSITNTNLVELRLKYIYSESDRSCSLYVNSFNGLFYLDTMYCLEPLDYTSIRVGVFDHLEPGNNVETGSCIYLRSWVVQGGGDLSFEAYLDGYNAGKADGEQVGYTSGYDVGFENGYKDGLLDSDTSQISVPEIITTYVNSGITLFRNIFGFEIFGINVAAFIGGLTAIVVLSWLIRKLVR